MNPYEEDINNIIDYIKAVPPSNLVRNNITTFLKRIIQNKLPEISLVLCGSSCSRTYLPDSDLDLILFYNARESNDAINENIKYLSGLFQLFCEEIYRKEQLCQSAGSYQSQNSFSQEFTIRNIDFINARTKLLHCLINNVNVDITMNQLASILNLIFFEQIDEYIQQNHLFKRSLLLVKCWCLHESLLYCNLSILASKEGMLSSYALSVLVLYLFNKFRKELNHPMDVLRKFLSFYSGFAWETTVLTIDGPQPIVNGSNNGGNANSASTKTTPTGKAFQDIIAPIKLRYLNIVTKKQQLRKASGTPTTANATAFSSGRFSIRSCNIQDPIDETNNLGISVSRQNLVHIKRALLGGHQKLEHLLNPQITPYIYPTVGNPNSNLSERRISWPKQGSNKQQSMVVPPYSSPLPMVNSNYPPSIIAPSMLSNAPGISIAPTISGSFDPSPVSSKASPPTALPLATPPVSINDPNLRHGGSNSMNNIPLPVVPPPATILPPFAASNPVPTNFVMIGSIFIREFFPFTFQKYMLPGTQRSDLLEHPMQLSYLRNPIVTPPAPMLTIPNNSNVGGYESSRTYSEDWTVPSNNVFMSSPSMGNNTEEDPLRGNMEPLWKVLEKIEQELEAALSHSANLQLSPSTESTADGNSSDDLSSPEATSITTMAELISPVNDKLMIDLDMTISTDTVPKNPSRGEKKSKNNEVCLDGIVIESPERDLTISPSISSTASETATSFTDNTTLSSNASNEDDREFHALNEEEEDVSESPSKKRRRNIPSAAENSNEKSKKILSTVQMNCEEVPTTVAQISCEDTPSAATPEKIPSVVEQTDLLASIVEVKAETKYATGNNSVNENVLSNSTLSKSSRKKRANSLKQQFIPQQTQAVPSSSSRHQNVSSELVASESKPLLPQIKVSDSPGTAQSSRKDDEPSVINAHKPYMQQFQNIFHNYLSLGRTQWLLLRDSIRKTPSSSRPSSSKGNYSASIARRVCYHPIFLCLGAGLVAVILLHGIQKYSNTLHGVHSSANKTGASSANVNSRTALSEQTATMKSPSMERYHHSYHDSHWNGHGRTISSTINPEADTIPLPTLTPTTSVDMQIKQEQKVSTGTGQRDFVKKNPMSNVDLSKRKLLQNMINSLLDFPEYHEFVEQKLLPKYPPSNNKKIDPISSSKEELTCDSGRINVFGGESKSAASHVDAKSTERDSTDAQPSSTEFWRGQKQTAKEAVSKKVMFKELQRLAMEVRKQEQATDRLEEDNGEVQSTSVPDLSVNKGDATSQATSVSTINLSGDEEDDADFPHAMKHQNVKLLSSSAVTEQIIVPTHWIQAGESITFGHFASLSTQFSPLQRAAITDPSEYQVFDGQSGMYAVSLVQYLWTKDGANLTTTAFPIYSIEKADYFDAGTYECYQLTSDSMTFSSLTLITRTIIGISKKPKVTTRPFYHEVKLGQSFYFQLDVEGLPYPHFRWYKNGYPLLNQSHSGILIEQMDYYHAGTYTCEIWNIAGNLLWLEATLHAVT